MSADVMSMSTFGRVTDPVKKIDMLLGYFYASDFSQSNLFQGKIQSLPQIVQDVGKNYQTMPARTESAVRQILLGYFDDVTISTNLTEIDGEKNSYKINISIDVVQDGKNYSATRISEVQNSVLMKYPNEYVG